ncbi:MAG: hypothetical protein NT071_15210 [Burkholderiales bacterium]|nr:hypothetical protein [Burkholderiales bacterium]
MTADAFHNIAQVEASLWEAADLLRANSNLTATEYAMPVLGPNRLMIGKWGV